MDSKLLRNRLLIASFILDIILIVAIAGWLYTRNNQSAQQKANQPILTQSVMQITSASFENNKAIPSRYTCDGTDINPPLAFSKVPAEAKSLALIVDDPDAPVGDWVHWTLWNIDPKTTEIAENTVPVGAIQGTTDSGKPGWGGPCPPSGTHRYQFKIYALDTVISLPTTAKKADIEKAMQRHILDQAMLIGLYKRK
jgi:Raf kinase inhibitor-like YbhB/YbcL family protein